MLLFKLIFKPGILFIILLHEKFRQFDWLRAVVFQLNLKYPSIYLSIYPSIYLKPFFLSLLIFKYTAKGQHAEIIKLFAKF